MDVLHSLAEDAAAAPDRRVPSATSDLGASPSDGPVKKTGAAPAVESDLEEDDWQFSEEIRVEGDDELEDGLAKELLGDLSADLDAESDFGESQDFGAGFDESALMADASTSNIPAPTPDVPAIEMQAGGDSESSSGLALDSPPASGELQRDESSFGSVDDFSSLMEDEEPAVAVDLAAEIASELEQEEASSAAVGTYRTNGPTDDLGDPESWDLVGSNDPRANPASFGNLSRSFANAQPIGPVDPHEFFSDDGSGASAYDDDLASSSIFAGPLALVGRVVGWTVSVGLVATILLLALQAEWARWAQTPQRVDNGPFQAETISSGWVQNSRSGPILRFEGQIRNTGTQAILPGIVQLTLLDAAGRRLTAPPIQAGVPIAQIDLREAAPEILEASLSKASHRLSGTSLAPGEIRIFEALVPEDQLPEAAQRVLLEIGESRVNQLSSNSATPALPTEVSADPVQSPVSVQLGDESFLSP